MLVQVVELLDSRQVSLATSTASQLEEEEEEVRMIDFQVAWLALLRVKWHCGSPGTMPIRPSKSWFWKINGSKRSSGAPASSS